MNKKILNLKSILLHLLLLTGSGFATHAMADGAAVYNSTCIVCHGDDGKGVLPGAPDFTDKAGRLSKSDVELFKNVVNGFQSPDSPMAMPPRGGNTSLSDDDVRDVLKYMRKTFGF